MRVPVPPVFAILTGLLLGAAIAHAQSLRIISPARGTVVSPGEKVVVRVTGSGSYTGLVVAGADVGFAGIIENPVGKPPWALPGEIRTADQAGKTSLVAEGVTTSGIEIKSNPVEIDVEPAGRPQAKISISPSSAIPLVSRCITLQDGTSADCVADLDVAATNPDGSTILLNRSTGIKFLSLSPSVLRLSPDGTHFLLGSPGSTKIVVSGKYFATASVDVTVMGTRR